MIDLCFSYWRNTRRRFCVVLLPVALKLAEILIPVLLGCLITDLAQAGAGCQMRIVWYLAAIALLHILNLVFDYCLELLKVREKVDYAVLLKRLAMTMLLYMTSQERESRTVAEWGQRVSGDTQIVADCASSAVLQVSGALWMLLFTTVVAVIQAPVFLVLMLFLCAVFFLIWRRNQLRLFQTAAAQRETAYRESSLAYDMVVAASLFPLYRAVPRMLARFVATIENTGKADVEAAKRSTVYTSQIKSALLVANVLGLAAGAVLYTAGMIQIGAVVTFSMLMGLAASHMGQLVFVLPVLNRGLESYGSLKSFFGELAWTLPLEPEAGSNQGNQQSRSEFAVETEMLEFAYASRPFPVFNKLCWRVKRGAYVSILGGNGAGKSTLIKLLLGILEPETGWVKRHFHVPGYVAQHTAILKASLWDNVTLCDSSASPERVNDVIRLSMLENLVNRLGGLHEQICREQLSGGEVQRIGLARALMQNPDILILDEVTNNLDIVCKGEVFQVLRGLKGRCTIVSVSHDMEALADSDECYLLQCGTLHQITGDTAQQRREVAITLIQNSYADDK